MFNVFASKPDLIDHSASPFNAEPPLDRLRASMTTRQADFYVRSHGDIPGLEETKHQLRVGGRRCQTTPGISRAISVPPGIGCW